MGGRELERDTVRGRSPEAWSADLTRALDRRDHESLRRVLARLQREICGQAEEVTRRSAGPTLDLLVEQARRILGSEPTDSEELEGELDEERRLWARFRERYRTTFVPAELHPFLDSCCAFLGPLDDGVQFPGFQKLGGVARGGVDHAVTLFARRDGPVEGETPANFFGTLDRRRGRFTVDRCYRTFLPRGAGELCIHEQLASLLDDPVELRELVFDNVQNTATYEAHVVVGDGGVRVREGVGWQETPLGRLGGRILSRTGRTVIRAHPRLDAFGFLDLGLEIG